MIKQQVCQKTTVDHCSAFKDYKTCETCNQGYYLANGKCVIFPKEVIDGCLTYIAERSCSKCQIQKYLKSSTECLDATAIADCLTYDQSASQPTCTACQPSHFVSQNKCITRQSVIDMTKCIILNKTADECLTCQTNFTLSHAKTACLQTPANCKTHAESSNTLTCSTCIDGFYNSNNVCTKGTKPNCITYAA